MTTGNWPSLPDMLRAIEQTFNIEILNVIIATINENNVTALNIIKVNGKLQAHV